MGISGLLPLLKSIHKPCNLKKFSGQTIGVDAYGWLHRGTVACAMELAAGRPTRKFVDFAMHRVRMLQHFGVIPYLVFDGDYLPSKAATETDRAKRREESKNLGLELEKAGKVTQAYSEFQKAVDVTPEMARQLIDELKKNGVQYVVAPYEADAQMVYLETKGIISAILSEDSDLLVFGAKCLLTKLDQYGNCIEINKANFCGVREISLTGWSDVEFRRMAILSGCDYLPSINNMGLKTAHRLVRKYKAIEKIIQMLQFDGKYRVPKEYLQNFYRAELTFLHQRVFCPLKQELVFHTEPAQPIDAENMLFIGAFVEPDLARGVATGDLNPMTKQPIVVDQRSTMSITGSRPFVSRPQSNQSITPSDLKKHKSIDAFFKPKRVPLAEMDINCFTPSPSQQAVLERNSGSWLSDPRPRPYLARNSTEPAQSSPHPAQRSTRSSGRSLSIGSLSTPSSRPPKRARLCADDLIDDSSSSIASKSELSRSRFFESELPDPSPSVRSSKTRKAKKQEIGIFSDDSVEEAMMSLPDFDGFSTKSKKSKKIAIFEDDSQTLGDIEVTKDEREGIESADSQPSLPSLTQGTSFRSSMESLLTPISTPRTVDLKDKFAFMPVTTPAPTPIASQLSSQSRIPVPTARPVLTARKSSYSTPLQRLGVQATRNRIPAILPITSSSFVPKQRVIDRIPFPDTASERLLAAQITPLPAADEQERKILLAAEEKKRATAEKITRVGEGGSEDLIIQDSEEEEDPLSPVMEKKALDLGKFVFAG